jgi:hypothetical protein
VSSRSLRRPAPQQLWPRPVSGAGLLLDTLTVQPNAAYSVCLKLRTAYAGGAFRVKRSSDNAQTDIGFTAANLVDTAALLSFCGAGNGTVTSLYDQTTNNRTMTPGGGEEPSVVNAGALRLMSSGKFAMYFTGSRRLRRTGTNVMGFGGNPAMTVGIALQAIHIDQYVWSFGVYNGASAAGGAGLNLYNSPTRGIRWTSIAGEFADFPYPSHTAPATIILGKPAGATSPSQYTAERDGVPLTAGFTQSGADMNIQDTQALLGASFPNFSSTWDGYINCWIPFNAVLAGADLTALRTELAAHV